MHISTLLSLVTQLEHLLHKLSIFPAKHQQLLVKQADVKISFSFIAFRIKLIQVYLILQKKKKSAADWLENFNPYSSHCYKCQQQSADTLAPG